MKAKRMVRAIAAGVMALSVMMMGATVRPAAADTGHLKIGVLTCAAGVEVGRLITPSEQRASPARDVPSSCRS